MKGLISLLPIFALGAPLSILGPGQEDRPGTLDREAGSGSRSTFEMRVRDSQTGRSVLATVLVERDDSSVGTGGTAIAARDSFRTDSAGRAAALLQPGHRRCEVSAQGYLSLRSHFTLESGRSFSMVFWLDPDDKPEELKAGSVAARLQDGYTLVHGHVVDSVTGMPLEAVRVRHVDGGEEALTDSGGYFNLMVPARAAWTDESAAATDEIMAERDGYKSHLIRGVTLPSGADTHFIVDMEPGIGLTTWDDAHSRIDADSPAMDADVRENEAEPLSPELAEWLSCENTRRNRRGTGREETGSEMPAICAGIRVGLLCPVKPCSSGMCPDCNVACATAECMTMETYVQRGLNDEWKREWDPNSLRAGAVAYRSVGTYRKAHPINANYDIRSDTCAQSYDIDTSLSTTAAATYTSGGVLKTATGTVVYSEYARENNMRDCADGQTGSPAGGWPCMSDLACATAARDPNSHGRGMCQNGSQRWATGTNVLDQVVREPWCWRCILDHYYNDNGNTTGAGTGSRRAYLSDNRGYPIVYSSNAATGSIYEIYKMQPDGSVRPRLTFNTSDWEPAISPDGERIAFASGRAGSFNSEIYVMSIDGTGVTRLTWVSGDDWSPGWSPDGSRIVFVSRRDGNPEIYVMNDDGSGQTRLTNDWGIDADPAWSPDGRRIAFRSQRAGDDHIFVMNTAGTELVQLTSGLGDDDGPAWSPDGRKIAFSSNRGGSYYQIYVMNADGTNLTRLTNTLSGNGEPAWEPNGRRIVFIRAAYLYRMNADGTGQTRLTFSGECRWPDWGRCPYIGP